MKKKESRRKTTRIVRLEWEMEEGGGLSGGGVLCARITETKRVEGRRMEKRGMENGCQKREYFKYRKTGERCKITANNLRGNGVWIRPNGNWGGVVGDTKVLKLGRRG